MEQDNRKSRIDKLGRRLDEINRANKVEARTKRGGGSSKGVALGMRIVTELLAAVLGGLVIGWFLDHWLGTSPWFLIGLLVLATGAAFRNVWKAASAPEGGRGRD